MSEEIVKKTEEPIIEEPKEPFNADDLFGPQSPFGDSYEPEVGEERPEPKKEELKAEEPQEDYEEETVELDSEEPQHSQDVDDYQRRIADLTEQVRNLTGIISSLQKPQTVPKAEEKPKEFDPLEGIDFDDAITTPEVFKKVLGRVYQQAFKDAQSAALKDVPSIVERQVNQAQTMNQMVNDFYSANPDLGGFKPTVGAIAQTISAENPHLGHAEILQKTAARTRELLKLPDPNVKRTRRKPAVPTPIKGGQRNKGSVLTGFEKEVMELIS